MAVTQADMLLYLRAKEEAAAAIGRVAASLGNLDQQTAKANTALGGLGGMLGGIGKAAAVAGLAIGGGLATGVGAAVTTAAGFEKSVSAIGAVAGATAAEMKQVSDLALQLGKDTSFSASEAAAGIEELVKGGLSLEDVFAGGAKAALNLAAAGTVSVADAAEIASNAVGQFGLKGAQLGRVADLIAGAANASSLSVMDFKFSLAAVGAVANTVGLSFDDTAVAIAELGKAGIKGSDAGTSLKTMLLNLQPATKAQNAEFRRLGLITRDGANQFFDATGRAKSLADIQGVLQKATAGMTDQQRLASLEILFGADAIRAAAVLSKGGAEGFTEMATAMGKVTAADVAREKLNNLAGSVETLKGSLETAAISVGLKFTPKLKELADKATGAVNAAIPELERLAEKAVTAGDTFVQALKGDWRPDGVDDSGNVIWVDPFVASVGKAGLAVKGFGDYLKSPEWAGSTDRAAKNLQDMNTEWDKFAAKFGGGKGPAADAGDSVDTFGLQLRELTAIGPNLFDFLNSVGEAFSAFGAGVALSAKAIQQVFTGDWMGATESVNAAADEFAKIPDIMDAQRERALERGRATAPALAAQARDDWFKYTTGAQESLAQLEPIVQEAIDAGAAILPELPAAVTAQLGPMASAAAELGTALEAPVGAAILETVANADGSLPGIPKAVTDQHAVMFSASTTLGERLQTPLSAGVLAAITDTEAKMPGVTAAVAAEQGPAGAASRGVGQNIVNGLGNALAGGLGWIRQQAANLAEAAISSARATLQERSPSQVFYEIGQNVTRGLVLGIQDGAPAVTTAVQAIVDAAIRNGIDPLHLLALAQAESSLNPRAHNTRGEDSVGLFQHNRAGGQGTGFSVAQLMDPVFSANKFAADHAALYKQLVEQGLTGERLVQAFGKQAERSAGDGSQYVAALRAMTAEYGHLNLAAGQAMKGQAMLGVAQQESNKWAETMAAQQAALNQVLSQQAPAMRPSVDAMTAFGAVLGPIERQVAGGAISMSTLQFKMTDLARATGIATQPWADLSAGLITQEDAMRRVINQSSDAGPAFEQLRQDLAANKITLDEATLRYLQLALGIAKVPEAAATVTSAVAPIGGVIGGQVASAAGQVARLSGSFDSVKTSIDGAREALRGYTNYLFELVPERQQEQERWWNTVRAAAANAADAVADYRRELESLPGGGEGSGLPGFASGGIVPGPRGVARLIVAHGGERVLSVAQQRVPTLPSLSFAGSGSTNTRGGDTYNISVTAPTANPRALAGMVRDELVKISRHNGGKVITVA